MATEQKIRWGILGTGRIAGLFARDFYAVHNGELFAVASRSQDAADAFAVEHRISRAYGDYHAMLAEQDLDIVYIGTPHSVHMQNAADAITAGKSVLCEKPLTI